MTWGDLPSTWSLHIASWCCTAMLIYLMPDALEHKAGQILYMDRKTASSPGSIWHYQITHQGQSLALQYSLSITHSPWHMTAHTAPNGHNIRLNCRGEILFSSQSQAFLTKIDTEFNYNPSEWLNVHISSTLHNCSPGLLRYTTIWFWLTKERKPANGHTIMASHLIM